jgi:polysaccharide pyruvyl transferase WcaK-like protein
MKFGGLNMTHNQSKRPLLGVLDTSVASENYGDFLIMDAATPVIDDVFSDYHKITFPTHERLGLKSYKTQKEVSLNIACGTNLLHSHMGLVRQWNIGLRDLWFLKPVVLFGVGWRSKKTRKTDRYTKWLLKKVLSEDHIHSVRDSYAEEKLRKIGINNVVNTSCPTMWHLDKDHCSKIPTQKGKNVVLVLTDYSQNKEIDRRLLNILKKEYKNIFFWCQGRHDYQYIKSLIDTDENIIILDGNISTFDKLLSDHSLSLDYVGTRLHGGIRALQNKRRSIIIGVDHRSLQKKEDFNLPVINRYVAEEELREYIISDLQLDINIPRQNINSWLKQFNEI